MNVETPASSGDPETDSLAEKRWVTAGAAISFSFPTTAGQFTGYAGGEPLSAFDTLNATQQAAARAMLASISTFTNLTFTEATGADAANAAIRFGMTDATETAHAYFPSTSQTGGDVWFNNSSGDYDDPVRGNYAWFTFAHEIGHALGLAHPHESTPPMAMERDSMQFTVMSYRSTAYDDIQGYQNETWGFSQSYMTEDIAALQFLYGANFNHNSGNNLYQWSPTTGEMFIDGVGQGAAGDNVIFLTVWDGGGIDTFDLSSHVVDTSVFYNPTSIDLRPGEGSYLQGQRADLGTGPFAYNFFVSHLYNGDTRSLIENAVGTNGRDVIRGNDAANHLDGNGGGDGTDELYGFGGDDVLVGGGFLFGGDGNDMLSGGGSMQGGTGNDQLYGGGWLEGNEGDDKLFAADGNDSLKGGIGQDTLHGEAGNDTLEGGEDLDALHGGAGNDELYGGAGDDTVTGGDGNDKLDGEAGNDRLAGGAGDDTYYLYDSSDEIVELAGEGIDTILTSISLTAPGAIENLTLPFGSGEPLPLNLTGNSLNNRLIGNGAANVLDGRTGADELMGGRGDDTYHVDNPNDLVFDFENGGTDTVYSSVSYVLTSTPPPVPPPPGYDPYAGASLRPDEPLVFAVEVLILTGTANLSGTGSEIANTLQGNSGNNLLDGKEGNDTLIGGAGGDALYGHDGDDTLFGDAGADTLDGGAGIDTLDYRNSSAAVTVSLLAKTGSGGDATGDVITGVENITGSSSGDALTGDAGANVLDGRGGGDTLIGLGGNDRYYVDAAGDVILEAVGGGTDTAYAKVSYTLGSGARIEILSTVQQTATTAINLTGNGIAQTITGNAGVNVLSGEGGDDVLTGLGGNDVLNGGLGIDSLDGGAGADALIGGAGDDIYYLDAAGDVIQEAVGEGTDTAYASVSYTLGSGARVEMLSTILQSATTAMNLTGNGIAQTITGNAGVNVLDGKGGNDTMIGLGGNDRYYVDSAGDVIQEAVGGGTDAAYTSISYTLGSGARVEIFSTIQQAATTAINLTGNGIAQTLYGNAGANVLDGKGGSDTMIGLGGADTFAFTTALGAGNVDTITGYSVADDTIRLDNDVFIGISAGALAAGAFATGAAATQADDRIIYNAATGALMFDADGSGAGAAVQFALLSTGLAMTNAEFLVV